jgi:hypothetical protein
LATTLTGALGRTSVEFETGSNVMVVFEAAACPCAPRAPGAALPDVFGDDVAWHPLASRSPAAVVTTAAALQVRRLETTRVSTVMPPEPPTTRPPR